MSKPRIAENTSNDKNDKPNDTQDNTSAIHLSTKLERRRRIEDLSEEKRLREELSAF